MRKFLIGMTLAVAVLFATAPNLNATTFHAPVIKKIKLYMNSCPGQWRLSATTCTDGFQDWYGWCWTGDMEGVYPEYLGSLPC